MRQITEKHSWNRRSVEAACIDNELYTRGTSRDYEKMLLMVESMKPTPEAIYTIAKDIAQHSDEDTTTIIAMHILANQSVITTYEIAE